MEIKNLILAAANKFRVYDKDGNFRKEVVIADSCHMGRNMQEITSLLRELGCTLKPIKDSDRGQGFLGESCQYYNRSEALEIAKNSGQPFNPDYILPKDRLDSSCIRHFPKDSSLEEYCTRSKS